MKINIKKTFICSLLEVQKKKLSSFYRNNFKHKFLFINKNWQWLYRVDFKKKIYPLALFVDGKMIGHSGNMPFEFLINKKKYISSWFIDFKIDPKFQNQGYGTYLVQEWKKKIQIGFAVHVAHTPLGSETFVRVEPDFRNIFEERMPIL